MLSHTLKSYQVSRLEIFIDLSIPRFCGKFTLQAPSMRYVVLIYSILLAVLLLQMVGGDLTIFGKKKKEKKKKKTSPFDALPPKPRAVVHIGPHKTESTYLQQVLLELAKPLAEENWYLPLYPKQLLAAKGMNGFVSNLRTHRGNTGAISDTTVATKGAAIVAKFSAYFNDSLSNHRNVIISSALFDRYQESAILNLRDMVQNFDVTIVFVYREWLSHYLTYYMESLRRKDGSNAIPSVTSSFSSYHEHQKKRHEPALQAREVLRRWTDVFGTENLRVIDFYGALAANKSISHVLVCEIMGVLCDSNHPVLSMNAAQTTSTSSPSSLSLLASSSLRLLPVSGPVPGSGSIDTAATDSLVAQQFHSLFMLFVRTKLGQTGGRVCKSVEQVLMEKWTRFCSDQLHRQRATEDGAVDKNGGIRIPIVASPLVELLPHSLGNDAGIRSVYGQFQNRSDIHLQVDSEVILCGNASENYRIAAGLHGVQELSIETVWKSDSWSALFNEQFTKLQDQGLICYNESVPLSSSSSSSSSSSESALLAPEVGGTASSSTTTPAVDMNNPRKNRRKRGPPKTTFIDTKDLGTPIPVEDHPLRANQYTTIIDTDNSTFLLKRTRVTNPQKSCYQIKRGDRLFDFCYPSIHVAGIAKAGTSALYRFFSRKYRPKVGVYKFCKEYCLMHMRKPNRYFTYLTGFVDGYSPKNSIIGMNGCLLETDLALLHNLLQPHAVYLMTIRALPTREWAAYNFWCDNQIDVLCNAKMDWTGPRMFRSPEMFGQLLRYVNYPNSPGYNRYLYKCSQYNNRYSQTIDRLEAVAKGAVIVVSSEGLLKDSETSGDHPLFRRMLSRIEKQLKIHLPVPGNGGPFHMEVVNAGNDRGAATSSTSGSGKNYLEKYLDPLGAKYEMSKNRQMLPSTQEYLMMCWTECNRMSQLTGYNYQCANTHITTGGSAKTNYLAHVSGPQKDLEMVLQAPLSH